MAARPGCADILGRRSRVEAERGVVVVESWGRDVGVDVGGRVGRRVERREIERDELRRC